jgi:hypothetical protein
VRYTLRIQKHAKITVDALERISSNIITVNPALQRLSRQDLLHIYIKLYIIKLLLKKK